jgi:processive 1,2-diacylglycerol beta-glucosyltransferase
MFKNLLILSASAGAGHVRAAEAVERAARDMGAAHRIRHIDVLELTTKVFRAVYSRAYIDMVNRAPQVLGWLYDQTDRPWENERLRLALDKLNTRRFVKLLEAEAPDICISTHFLPSGIISWLRAKERLSARQAIVVTDFDVHAMWLCRHFEQYFVALDETRVLLEKLGVAPGKVTVSGIPIDPVFTVEKDRRAMRRKHGLDEERTTILVSAGGFGVGPMERLVRSLLEIERPAQVVAIAGRSEELKAGLDRLRDSLPARNRVSLHPVGFTREIDEYMAAADLLVGKPGGLTTSEALARGLVMVVVNPIPGQEERNADHLLEEGAALRSNNLPALAYKIERLLDDPARLEAMRANVKRLARPDAARDIVRKLVELEQSGAWGK